MSQSSTVAIIGTGWMARALGGRLAEVAGMNVVFGSRQPEAATSSGWAFPGPVTSVAAALQQATIVFLAVPPAAHASLLQQADLPIDDMYSMKSTALYTSPTASTVVDSSSGALPAAADFSGKVVVDLSNKLQVADFSGKVVVDLSNTPELYDKWFGARYSGPSVAEQLQALLDAQVQRAGGPPCHVVKAMNSLSAYALADTFSRHFKQQVPVACNNQEAAKKVCTVLEAMQLSPICVGALSKAGDMERKQFQVFPEWWWPLLVTFIQFSFWCIYDTVWYAVVPFPGFPVNGAGPRFLPKQWPCKIFNKIAAHTGYMNLLILFLGGIVASFYQLARRDAHTAFPTWLRRWLDMRKQLGLIAVFFVALHVLLVLATLTPQYNATMYDIPVAGQSPMMNAYGESLVLIGAVALLLLLVMSICSLPAVSSVLGYKEWQLMFSYVGYAVVVLAFVHLMLYEISFYFCPACVKSVVGAWSSFPTQTVPGTNTVYYLPTGRVYLELAAMLVLFLKLVVSLPPLSIMLNRLRSGAGKKTDNCKRSTNTAGIARPATTSVPV